MTVRFIAFTGPAGAGKDECGRFLMSHGWTKLSFAAPIYDALEAMGFGRPSTQAEKEAIIPWLGVSWRHLATTLGTEWGRDQVHKDIWIILAKRYVEKHAAARFVMTDTRFENEATMVREVGGRLVHLRGREDPNRPTAHRSEQGVQLLDGDIVLHNDTDGIETLHDKLRIALRAWL